MADQISTANARQQFSDVVNRTAYGGERIVLTRRGKGLAAMVPLEDLELLRKIEDAIDALDVRASLREAQDDGVISLEDLKAELGIS